MTASHERISVCMIVRDEEENLSACLASLGDLADELIVADTGSMDRTREFARAAGAIVLKIPWEKDFSRARNAALEQASGDWILVLDADEQLISPDIPALLNLIASTSEQVFTLEVRSELAGGALTITPISRLFRNRPEFRYQGRLHEQILPSIATWLGAPSLTPPPSGLAATHSGYLPEVRQAREKMERNETLLRMMAEEQPGDGDTLFLLARELCQEIGGDLLRTPRSREALELLEESWALLESKRLAHVADLGIRRLRAKVAFGLEGEIQEEVVFLEKTFGPSLLLHFALGEIALAQGNPDTAIGAFAKCLTIRSNPVTGDLDARYARCWSQERIARAYLAMGELLKAYEAANQAMEAAPGEAGPRLVLASVTAAGGDNPRALTQIVGAARTSPHDPRPHLELARILINLGREKAAHSCLDAALKLAPGWEDALELLADHTK